MVDPTPSPTAPDYKALGDRFAAAGDFDKAGAAYVEYLRQNPSSVDAALAVARAARETRKFALAVRVLETAQRINPLDLRLFEALEVTHTVENHAARRSDASTPVKGDITALSFGSSEFSSDAECLVRLRELVMAGDVRVELDMSRLRAIHSPVFVEAEVNIWAFGIVVLAVAALGFFDWTVAVGIAALVALGYGAFGRRRITRRIAQRVHRDALEDIRLWRNLWSYGGVTLRAEAATMAADSCVAPTGSWVIFARRFSDRGSPAAN